MNPLNTVIDPTRMLATLNELRRIFDVKLADEATLPVNLPLSRFDLPDVFRTLGFRTGAEVGVWKGGYSAALCEGIPGLALRCVDPWRCDDSYAEQKNNPVLMAAAYDDAVARLTPLGCDIVRLPSLTAAAQVPHRSLDFVYIDANHERQHVLNDLAVWTTKIRPGGIIAGHDYREQATKPFIQVKAAVDEFTAARGITPWFILTGDRTPSFLWVVA